MHNPNDIARSTLPDDALEQIANESARIHNHAEGVFLLKRWWSKQEIIEENDLISKKVSRLSALERRTIAEAASRL